MDRALDPTWSARLAAWTEAALYTLALVGLATCGWRTFEAHLFEARGKAELTEMARQARPSRAHPRPAAPPAIGELLGQIDVPRLGISALIVEGAGGPSLRHAVGHVPGTALPGEGGNVALAGHRDSYFRDLGEVAPGDEIVLRTPAATYRYAVASTRVVAPETTAVLAATASPSLTLITCYPFHYVGPAPQRFIVRARLDAVHASAPSAAR